MMNFPLLLLFFSLIILLSSTTDIIFPDSFDSCKGFTITSTSFKFGYTTNIGDINDDEIPDIIISDYKYSAVSTLYVIYGTKTFGSDIDVDTMTSTQGFKITNLPLHCTDNPYCISTEGDVDGDGIIDIVIGAANADSPKGAVYVVYGKKGGYLDFDINSLTDDMGYKINGPTSGRFGWNVNTKSDVNGDKINDIVIGNKVASGNGVLYVVYGQSTRGSALTVATMPAARGFKITGAAGVYLGQSVSSAGDFNQDGIDDFVVSAPGVSSYLGASYVIYGKKEAVSSYSYTDISLGKGFTITAASPAYKLALAVADGGDFNNDGVSDVLLGAYSSNSDEGIVYIVYGKKNGPADFVTSGMDASQGMIIEGISAAGLFGSSLVNIGDINGDGISDIFLGAKYASSGKGEAYIIYGMKNPPLQIDLSTLTPQQGFKLSGSLTNGFFGNSATKLRDINQDGIPDLIIGASGQMKAFVLFGSNGWACDVCWTASTCQTCQPGYNYTYNGKCYWECPVYAPFKVGSQCFSEDPTKVEEEISNEVNPFS